MTIFQIVYEKDGVILAEINQENPKEIPLQMAILDLLGKADAVAVGIEKISRLNTPIYGALLGAYLHSIQSNKSLVFHSALEGHDIARLRGNFEYAGASRSLPLYSETDEMPQTPGNERILKALQAYLTTR